MIDTRDPCGSDFRYSDRVIVATWGLDASGMVVGMMPKTCFFKTWMVGIMGITPPLPKA